MINFEGRAIADIPTSVLCILSRQYLLQELFHQQRCCFAIFFNILL